MAEIYQTGILEYVLLLLYSPPYATEDQAIKMRALRCSVMEYTSFNWSKVPSSLQRRTADKPFENPQIVTTRFR